jgi:PKD repeat protein
MKYLLFSLLFPVFLSAQTNPVGKAHYDNTWLNGYDSFSNDTLFGGTTMTFDTYPPKIIRNPREMDFYITNSGFSDTNGKGNLYFNGYFIQNEINDTIMNGDSINPDYSLYQDVLYQGGLFLPQPANDSIVYLFHEEATSTPLTVNSATVFLAQYTIINIAANNGLGKVILKNIPLLQDTLCFGKLTATKHANGRDWWIIIPTYNQNIYYKYLLTPHGIDTFPTQTIGNPTYSSSGQATFSPNGSKYVKLNSPGYEYGSWMDIFDFDRCTGELSNYQGFYKNIGGTAGVSISPNSRYLYFSRGITVHQYDLWASNVESSELLVAEYDGFLDPLPTTFWMQQLALDGKIYVGSSSSVQSYHVIKNPDKKGLDCNFTQHSFRLPTIAGKSIPTFPYYRLGPLDGSSCDTLGINNLPIADFRIDNTLDTFDFNFIDLSYYEPTSWQWDFDDGSHSMERNPTHTFATSGIYNVCLIVKNEYAADTICKTVKIGNIVPIFEIHSKPYQFIAIPNPASDFLSIAYSSSIESSKMNAQLISPTGAIVANTALLGQQGTIQVDVSQWPTGLYYLRFVADDQTILIQKISIIH